jgi:hypothetical protein
LQTQPVRECQPQQQQELAATAVAGVGADSNSPSGQSWQAAVEVPGVHKNNTKAEQIGEMIKQRMCETQQRASYLAFNRKRGTRECRASYYLYKHATGEAGAHWGGRTPLFSRKKSDTAQKKYIKPLHGPKSGYRLSKFLFCCIAGKIQTQ